MAGILHLEPGFCISAVNFSGPEFRCDPSRRNLFYTAGEALTGIHLQHVNIPGSQLSFQRPEADSDQDLQPDNPYLDLEQCDTAVPNWFRGSNVVHSPLVAMFAGAYTEVGHIWQAGDLPGLQSLLIEYSKHPNDQITEKARDLVCIVARLLTDQSTVLTKNGQPLTRSGESLGINGRLFPGLRPIGQFQEQDYSGRIFFE